MSDGKLNFIEEDKTKYGKVTCLGKTFNNDEERREYFRNELRKKLPDLKKIEGFPIGEDEDIIALSDPPYYTACPNPWLNDFIDEWEKEKETIPGRKTDFKVDVPFASDINEGKNNPIYNAHSYHTKVPHPAIMRYILHYTQPGDIIFDGFAGTGMTGVAAQMCGDPDTETKGKIEKEWREAGLGKANWGNRKALLGDLSSIASFIAYNYNTPVDTKEFEKEARIILSEVEDECSWMYSTIPENNKLYQKVVEEYHSQIKNFKKSSEVNTFYKRNKSTLGKINYIVWSDIFICSECGGEINYWDAAINFDTKEVKEKFHCPKCKTLHSKTSCEKAWITTFDKEIGQSIKQVKSRPVLINYSYASKRFYKNPDLFDLEILNKTFDFEIPYWLPNIALPMGYNTQQPMKSHGITYTHHFYTRRNLSIIAKAFNSINSSNINYKSKAFLRLWFTASLNRLDKLNRYAANHNRHVGPLANTLYISSTPTEISPFYFFGTKLNDLLIETAQNYQNLIEIHSATSLQNIKNNSADYIFVDPPFGGNIMYSELNFYYEKWLGVSTNNSKEAIQNDVQKKGIFEYQSLMEDSFNEFYRILKPNKWMTVEFSNTSAAIWNSIQYALSKSGFIIANVSIIDKGRPGLHGIVGPTAVKQDLIISCYKPSEVILNNAKQDLKDIFVWDFIREHLEHLPIKINNSEKKAGVIERTPRILYDRLITFFLMNGLQIPIDAADFQIALKQKFPERDGMYFTNKQVAEYDEDFVDKKNEQYILLFDSIYSEVEAVLWLKERLRNKPQTYQDIMPSFRIANRATRKGELFIELQTILEENFIQENNGKWRVPNLNEAKDREALRNKSLLKEFDKYKDELANPKIKKIKEVRVEALRSGFKMCWDKKDFKTIINLGDKIPQNILLEDEQLLMYYDIAKDRI